MISMHISHALRLPFQSIDLMIAMHENGDTSVTFEQNAGSWLHKSAWLIIAL